MVHHYDEEKPDESTDRIDMTIHPHPDTKETKCCPMPAIPELDFPPLGPLPAFMPPRPDPVVIQELAVAMLSAFGVGFATAALIAYFSRRTSIDA